MLPWHCCLVEALPLVEEEVGAAQMKEEEMIQRVVVAEVGTQQEVEEVEDWMLTEQLLEEEMMVVGKPLDLLPSPWFSRKS